MVSLSVENNFRNKKYANDESMFYDIYKEIHESPITDVSCIYKKIMSKHQIFDISLLTRARNMSNI